MLLRQPFTYETRPLRGYHTDSLWILAGFRFATLVPDPEKRLNSLVRTKKTFSPPANAVHRGEIRISEITVSPSWQLVGDTVP